MKNLKKILSRIIESPWFYPLALLFIGIIAYGLMIPRLGFYWDDWEGVYFYKLHDTAISFHYYPERPLSVLIYLVLFPFIKMTPVVMQLILLILRWGGVLFIFYTLNLVWPEHTWLNRWIGALLFVFPGFFDQQVSVAFSQHFATFLLFSCSLFLTALAIRNHKYFWLWMPLSVVLGITQIFMMEYFVGLEIIRPIIIWFMLQSQRKEKRGVFSKTLLYWLPFLISLGVYIWWRFFYLSTTLTAEDPYSLVLLKTILSSPVDGLITLIGRIYQDVRYLLFSVWPNAFFNPDNNDLHAKMIWFSWLLGITVAILFYLSTRKTSREQESAPANSFIWPIIIGIVALLAGGIPVWLLGRQISIGKWSDRFALAPMVGAVIIVVYLVAWLFRTHKQKQWFLTLLLGFSISAQIWNGNTYRLDWALQKNIYWQLAWRVPALKPGTAVIGKGTFTDKSSYYDGVYIINILFDTQIITNARYSYFDVIHLADDSYVPNVSLSTNMRGGQFSGNTSQAIGMYFNLSGGCVRILDNVYKDDPNFTDDINSKDRLNKLITISNVNQIVADANPRTPDPAIFGMEPSHSWCYYFEKADLARQIKDWHTVLQLGSEAESKGFKPVMGAEYIPFIEAYAQIGEWSKAYNLSLVAQNITPDLGISLCNNWQRFVGITSGADRDVYLAKAKSEFCKPITR